MGRQGVFSSSLFLRVQLSNSQRYFKIILKMGTGKAKLAFYWKSMVFVFIFILASGSRFGPISFNELKNGLERIKRTKIGEDLKPYLPRSEELTAIYRADRAKFMSTEDMILINEFEASELTESCAGQAETCELKQADRASIPKSSVVRKNRYAYDITDAEHYVYWTLDEEDQIDLEAVSEKIQNQFSSHDLLIWKSSGSTFCSIDL